MPITIMHTNKHFCTLPKRQKSFKMPWTGLSNFRWFWPRIISKLLSNYQMVLMLTIFNL